MRFVLWFAVAVLNSTLMTGHLLRGEWVWAAVSLLAVLCAAHLAAPSAGD